MEISSANEVAVGGCRGELIPPYSEPAVLARLENMAVLLSSEGSAELAKGRHRTVRVPLMGPGECEVVVKAFGGQSWVKDGIDRSRGSKARRTWQAARFLHQCEGATPTPIGFLERWHGARLVESYYLSAFEPARLSFRDELIRLFREEPECERFMHLLECVARRVRQVHDAGFRHNDLGNQNILLRRTPDGEWRDVQFIDLNRSRWGQPLSLRARARDLSRIYLPSDLLRVFKEMYWDVVPPRAFQRWERFYRALYALHASTRDLRHPRRARRRKAAPDRGAGADYPSEQDMWIWDERSAQAIGVIRSRDRRRLRSAVADAGTAAAVVAALPRIWREYRKLRGECFSHAVPVDGCIGVAVDPRPGTAELEMERLAALGRVPVMVRFYHHEKPSNTDFRLAALHELSRRGHPVSIALVQDRRAVRYPSSWQDFASRVLAGADGIAEWVEIGHAVNRVKWGIWDKTEHRVLLQRALQAAEPYPALRLMGPAVIDFEYHAVVELLRNAPAGLHFQALSHHLYVDRRGAPENRQGPFRAVDKFALARAIARTLPACEDRVIVSEVNWPLSGTGVYSPVGSPYESPGTRFNDPSVSEDDYADFMVRYLLLAVCSGMVDRVFWWRLAARGFGLIDDGIPGQWRNRPAYDALCLLLRNLRGATFTGRVTLQPEDVSRSEDLSCFRFSFDDGHALCVAYCVGDDTRIRVPFAVEHVVDTLGKEERADDGCLTLSGRPVYLYVAAGDEA